MSPSTDPAIDSRHAEPVASAGGADGPSDADRSASEPPVPGAAELTSVGFRNFQRYTYWSLVAAVLAVLVLPPLAGPIPHPPHPLGTTSIVMVLITAVALVRLVGHHIPPRAAHPRLTPTAWWLWTVLGGTASVILAGIWIAADDRFLWPFGPAMIGSMVIASFPRRKRNAGVIFGVAAAAVVGATIDTVLGAHPPAATAVTAALVTGFAMTLTLATIWSWRIVVQLNDAKRTATTLAVANERLRFAADLHDIQGHNLQVIALKSELAHRLLPRDPDRAGSEIAAVQELAADALRDTRAVVQGYRRATLDAEIANATGVLGSAGIDTRLDLPLELRDVDDDLRLSSHGRHLLGLVVREAVTNVLRHSNATWASVALALDEGTITLTIENDGVVDHNADQSGPVSGGGGLDGLAERLRAIGGSLEWRCDLDRFEVRARLPLSGAR